MLNLLLVYNYIYKKIFLIFTRLLKRKHQRAVLNTRYIKLVKPGIVSDVAQDSLTLIGYL